MVHILSLIILQKEYDYSGYLPFPALKTLHFSDLNEYFNMTSWISFLDSLKIGPCPELIRAIIGRKNHDEDWKIDEMGGWTMKYMNKAAGAVLWKGDTALSTPEYDEFPLVHSVRGSMHWH